MREKIVKIIAKHTLTCSSLCPDSRISADRCPCFDAASAALTALEAAGYAVVPKEPTMKQLSAGQTAWIADPLKKSSTLYRAMIAAAEEDRDE